MCAIRFSSQPYTWDDNRQRPQYERSHHQAQVDRAGCVLREHNHKGDRRRQQYYRHNTQPPSTSPILCRARDQRRLDRVGVHALRKQTRVLVCNRGVRIGSSIQIRLSMVDNTVAFVRNLGYLKKTHLEC